MGPGSRCTCGRRRRRGQDRSTISITTGAVMGEKFIPNSDTDFRVMASSFADVIARDPARCAVTQSDAEALSVAVERFCQAHQTACAGATRSPRATRAKAEARGAAERIIRRLAPLTGASEGVDRAVKETLNIRERPAR